jgi:hypothetical protein
MYRYDSEGCLKTSTMTTILVLLQWDADLMLENIQHRLPLAEAIDNNYSKLLISELKGTVSQDSRFFFHQTIHPLA